MDFLKHMCFVLPTFLSPFEPVKNYNCLGPLIMTYFLSAPPWDHQPPPHLHTRTCTHGAVPAHTPTPAATRKFSPNAEDLSPAEERIRAAAHLLPAAEPEMRQ